MYQVQLNPNITHTIGNGLFIMTEYIKSLFEQDFFSYVHIGSRIAYKEFMRQEAMIRSQIIKKRRPILVIRPRPIFFDDDIFMARSAWTTPINNTMFDKDTSNYIALFRDDKHDISISYMMNRMRIQTLCTIMVETEIQQQNIYNALRNQFVDNRIYWMKNAMEINVPPQIINLVSELSGVPVHDPETGLTRKFLNYLMSNANRYFTYKKDSATGNEEFFVYYPLTMELVFTDWSLEDLEKKNMVSENASINFTFTTEFNTIGSYQISTERDDSVLRANTVITTDATGTVAYPMFTVDNLFRETNKDGYKLFYTNIFNIDPDVKREDPDILDLSPVFRDSDLKEILRYMDNHGTDYNILFNFIIMKNNKMLNSDRKKGKVDYIVDLHKQRILVYNKTKNATYRLVIYLNNLYILKIMNEINEFERRYDDPEYIPNKDGKEEDRNENEKA